VASFQVTYSWCHSCGTCRIRGCHSVQTHAVYLLLLYLGGLGESEQNVAYNVNL
jgi:hypothetical protein